MKKGLSVILGLVLMLTSFGCVIEPRDDEYRRHHEEYREQEEHRDGGYEREREEHRERDELRDYDDRR
jgi:hypothetical protein